MAEIKSYGGAGSAFDQVEKWFGKQATGASIPKDILDNMEQVNKSISDNAGSTYNTKLGGINQNYRSNFQPVKIAGAKSGSGPAAGMDGDGVRHRRWAVGSSGRNDRGIAGPFEVVEALVIPSQMGDAGRLCGPICL